MPSKKRWISCAFAVVRLAERPHAETVAVAQRARNRDDALQVQLQKVAAGDLAAALERHRRDLGVADFGGDAVELAQPGDVGDRLDIENQNRCHYLRVQAPALFW